MTDPHSDPKVRAIADAIHAWGDNDGGRPLISREMAFACALDVVEAIRAFDERPEVTWGMPAPTKIVR